MPRGRGRGCSFERDKTQAKTTRPYSYSTPTGSSATEAQTLGQTVAYQETNVWYVRETDGRIGARRRVRVPEPYPDRTSSVL